MDNKKIERERQEYIDECSRVGVDPESPFFVQKVGDRFIQVLDYYDIMDKDKWSLSKHRKRKNRNI